MSVRIILNLIKDRFRLWVPKWAWYSLARVKKLFIRRDFSELVKTNSSEEHPLFFVIRREPPGAGLFSNLNHVLQGLREAEIRGLIPVVDMQNYWTSYSIPKIVNGSRNAWEYFFDQPTKYSLDSAYSSRRYVLSRGNRIGEGHWLTQKSLEFALDSEKIVELNRVLTKYFRFNSFTKSSLAFVKSKIEWNPQECLGVSLRGTDYLQIQPQGHPRQPNIEVVLKEIDEALDKQEFKSIFLACEDPEIRNAIEKRFSRYIIKNFREMEFFKDYISSQLILSKRNSEIIKNTLGYLIEIILFSECRSCVTSLANGSVIGLALNGDRFVDKKIMTTGVY